MIRDILIVNRHSGLIEFQKRFLSVVPQPLGTASLLAALLHLVEDTVRLPMRSIRMGSISVSFALPATPLSSYQPASHPARGAHSPPPRTPKGDQLFAALFHDSSDDPKVCQRLAKCILRSLSSMSADGKPMGRDARAMRGGKAGGKKGLRLQMAMELPKAVRLCIRDTLTTLLHCSESVHSTALVLPLSSEDTVSSASFSFISSASSSQQVILPAPPGGSGHSRQRSHQYQHHRPRTAAPVVTLSSTGGQSSIARRSGPSSITLRNFHSRPVGSSEARRPSTASASDTSVSMSQDTPKPRVGGSMSMRGRRQPLRGGTTPSVTMGAKASSLSMSKTPLHMYTVQSASHRRVVYHKPEVLSLVTRLDYLINTVSDVAALGNAPPARLVFTSGITLGRERGRGRGDEMESPSILAAGRGVKSEGDLLDISDPAPPETVTELRAVRGTYLVALYEREASVAVSPSVAEADEGEEGEEGEEGGAVSLSPSPAEDTVNVVDVAMTRALLELGQLLQVLSVLEGSC
ncbi:hypothetical protein KIPB_000281 [Kipferlia bialata]|uniref:Uncharacterized protein n=1 Tax=Kipferlia bialata TaxID=797122 RepID=A0A391NU07_9EUKA|nr:hypothetical protein KIPB_000281 [Kipferlia bialata]|eukprot:g281.t1